MAVEEVQDNETHSFSNNNLLQAYGEGDPSFKEQEEDEEVDYFHEATPPPKIATDSFSKTTNDDDHFGFGDSNNPIQLEDAHPLQDDPRRDDIDHFYPEYQPTKYIIRITTAFLFIFGLLHIFISPALLVHAILQNNSNMIGYLAASTVLNVVWMILQTVVYALGFFSTFLKTKKRLFGATVYVLFLCLLFLVTILQIASTTTVSLLSLPNISSRTAELASGVAIGVVTLLASLLCIASYLICGCINLMHVSRQESEMQYS